MKTSGCSKMRQALIQLLDSVGLPPTVQQHRKQMAINAIAATIADFQQWGIVAFTADFLAAELPNINRHLIAAFLREWKNVRYNGTTIFFVLKAQQAQTLSNGFAWNYSGKTQTWTG